MNYITVQRMRKQAADQPTGAQGHTPGFKLPTASYNSNLFGTYDTPTQNFSTGTPSFDNRIRTAFDKGVSDYRAKNSLDYSNSVSPAPSYKDLQYRWVANPGPNEVQDISIPPNVFIDNDHKIDKIEYRKKYPHGWSEDTVDGQRRIQPTHFIGINQTPYEDEYPQGWKSAPINDKFKAIYGQRRPRNKTTDPSLAASFTNMGTGSYVDITPQDSLAMPAPSSGAERERHNPSLVGKHLPISSVSSFGQLTDMAKKVRGWLIPRYSQSAIDYQKRIRTPRVHPYQPLPPMQHDSDKYKAFSAALESSQAAAAGYREAEPVANEAADRYYKYHSSQLGNALEDLSAGLDTVSNIFNIGKR